MSKGKAESRPKPVTFEKALSRLQDIVSELEDPEKGLEASLVLFEEGVALSRFCRGRIDEIERRVEVVLKETAGARMRDRVGYEVRLCLSHGHEK